ncbi:MAG: hypothetical protein AAGA48_18985 [Myxococcota bacterium]
MQSVYRCASQRRRRLVLTETSLNGIDFIEVDPDQPTTLTVHLLRPAPVNLDATDFEITGGVRTTEITVEQLLPVLGQPSVVRLVTNRVGDHSEYRLNVIGSATTEFDPVLRTIGFGFLAHCDVGLDCPTPTPCPPEPLPIPELDHLARDFESLRRLMLERLTVLRPDWTRRTAIDPMVMLVEALAYEGDRLSYALDAVSQETYLGTARQRASLRRHARLLDYTVHEGAAARAWVQLQVSTATNWDATQDPMPRFFAGGGAEDGIAFVVAEPAFTVHPDNNALPFHTWGEVDCCVPRGATEIDLDVTGLTPSLTVGDTLLLEQTRDPTTLEQVDADPAHRHIARIRAIEVTADPVTSSTVWRVRLDDEDALPFALRVSVDPEEGPPVSIAIARGNLVLLEHGEPVELIDRTVDLRWGDRYELRLDEVASIAPSVPVTSGSSVAAMRQVDPARAVPAITLIDETGAHWDPQPHLFDSASTDRHYVLETSHEGRPSVRFGDGQHGALPVQGDGRLTFTATLRLGGGEVGNVGAEAITRALDFPAHNANTLVVRNPLPAFGGQRPESVEAIRRDVPEAYRYQERAVRTDDYARVVEAASPQVARAVAHIRQTGTHRAVEVAVDLRGGGKLSEEPELRAVLRSALEDRRTLGFSVRLRDARLVPLDLALVVILEPAASRSVVRSRLRTAFAAGREFDGEAAFFHPDRFTFGDPLYFSALVAHARAVPGVCSVETDATSVHGGLLRFQRWGVPPDGELDRGVIRPAPREILEAWSDPNRPERGRIHFHLLGGR